MEKRSFFILHQGHLNKFFAMPVAFWDEWAIVKKKLTRMHSSRMCNVCFCEGIGVGRVGPWKTDYPPPGGLSRRKHHCQSGSP